MTAARGARKQAPQVPATPPPLPPPAAKKKPSTKMIGAVGGIAVLAAVFMFTRGGGEQAAGPASPAVTAAGPSEAGVPPDQHEGPVVALDSITVNLVDGKFLRLGLALQLTAEAKADDLDPKSFGARALDSAIQVMSGYTSDELASGEGRGAAKEVLAQAVIKRYPGEVVDVYFTDFVMQ